jgi:hypothetical protein
LIDLEIVDDRERVPAMIRVFTSGPTVEMPDGTTGHPKTVLLKLIDSEGAPNDKIAATEDGSGLNFGGASQIRRTSRSSAGAQTL